MQKPDSTVLLVGTFLSAARANHSVGEELAHRLAASGWEVLMTSSRPSRLGRLADMVATTWRRRQEYAVAHVDVYSGLAFGWAEAVCFVLRRTGRPYVLTLRGGNLPAFARRWPRRVRRLLGSAEVVTAPSRFLLEEMAPYQERLRLLPNPLDVEAYPFRLRREAAPRLVWLRAFHQIYNPGLAPQVLALLQKDFPDLQLAMVGPDKDGSLHAVRETAAREGVAGRITFPGGVPHGAVARWLQQGDVFLNTANVDNTPVSVLEAMACGLCVVSTEVGGIPYLLEHEHDALLVPPGDPRAMAAAVRRLLTEPPLAERLSRNARRKAEQFDWTVLLPRWGEVLKTAKRHA